MAFASLFVDWSSRLSGALMGFTPPDWLRHELEDKAVLCVNHVLGQEPAALARLQRQKGRCIQLDWRGLHVQWCITPAGLFERARLPQEPDLRLHVQQEKPWDVLQTLAQGEKPPMRVEGDVMLAADINWLVDHVRWDVEEDVSRFIGDAAAHHLMRFIQRLTPALREFVAR